MKYIKLFENWISGEDSQMPILEGYLYQASERNHLRNFLLHEALKLQIDRKRNELVVVSDLEEKEAKKETFQNKEILKKNGFKWNWETYSWTIPVSQLEKAKETLSLINKTEYIIDSLEELDDALKNSREVEKDDLRTKISGYVRELANETDEKKLSEEIGRYLQFFSKFHKYSFNNRMLIYLQRPDATYVGSIKFWRDQKNRRIKKEAFRKKGIKVWVPLMHGKKPNPDEVDMEEMQNGEEAKVIETPLTFTIGNVYDISDTEPISYKGEVPETPMWWDDNTPSETADELFGYVSEVALDMGIQVTTSDSSRGEKGFAAGDHINISSDVQGVGRLSVMIHEMAHELMHFRKSSIFYQDDEVISNTELKELQAESVSFVVLKHYGIPVKQHTTYLALWNANAEKIEKNLEVISNVARFVIQKIDEEAERMERLKGELNPQMA